MWPTRAPRLPPVGGQVKEACRSRDSALARLAELLDLPVHHLDLHYWQPGWTRMPRERWRRVVEDLSRTDAWILDGEGDDVTIDACLARTEMLVYLDLPRRRRLRRILARWLTSAREKTDGLPAGCPEPLTWSTLAWAMWKYERITAPHVRAALGMLSEDQGLVLRSTKDISEWIEAVTDELNANGRPTEP